MHQSDHPEFEAATRRMQAAAEEVAEADHEGLLTALRRFSAAKVDWQNAIPRDGLMRPLPGVLG